MLGSWVTKHWEISRSWIRSRRWPTSNSRIYSNALFTFVITGSIANIKFIPVEGKRQFSIVKYLMNLQLVNSIVRFIPVILLNLNNNSNEIFIYRILNFPICANFSVHLTSNLSKF